jgi:hypothetical protein
MTGARRTGVVEAAPLARGVDPAPPVRLSAGRTLSLYANGALMEADKTVRTGAAAISPSARHSTM